MNATPERFDMDFWRTVLKTVGRLSLVGAAVIGASTGTELVAERQLDQVEFKDGRENRDLLCGQEMQDLLMEEADEQARCDTALEVFTRHREDEEEWANVLRNCHSGEAR